MKKKKQKKMEMIQFSTRKKNQLLKLPENKLSTMRSQKLVSWRMLLLLLKVPENQLLNLPENKVSMMRFQKLVSWGMLLVLLKLSEKQAVNDAVSEVGKLGDVVAVIEAA